MASLLAAQIPRPRYGGRAEMAMGAGRGRRAAGAYRRGSPPYRRRVAALRRAVAALCWLVCAESQDTPSCAVLADHESCADVWMQRRCPVACTTAGGRVVPPDLMPAELPARAGVDVAELIWAACGEAWQACCLWIGIADGISNA